MRFSELDIVGKNLFHFTANERENFKLRNNYFEMNSTTYCMVLNSFLMTMVILKSSSNGYGQSYGIRGSFAIAAIANDGIVVLADSRGSFFDIRQQDPVTHKYKTLAYFDEMQKFFIIKGNVLILTGTSLVGNLFVNTIVDDFVLKADVPSSVKELPKSFMNFCKVSMPAPMFQQIQNNAVIAAGYDNGTPIICSYGDNQILASNGFRESYKSDYRQYYSNKKGSIELAQQAEKTIAKYAKEHKMEFEIGGQIHAIQLKPDKSITWISSHPGKFKWRTIQDFLKDYFEEKVKINFPTQEGKIFFDEQAKILATQQ